MAKTITTEWNNGLFAAKCISPGEIVTMYPYSLLRIGEVNDANEKRLSMGSYATELENYAFNVKDLFRDFSVPVFKITVEIGCYFLIGSMTH